MSSMSEDSRSKRELAQRRAPPLRVQLPNRVTFNRLELNRILNLYGRMVADGEWRDYAIDFLKDRAVFSVFRRASEVPIYRIEKDPRLARKQGMYSVISATGLILRRGHELERVLLVIDRKLAVVVADTRGVTGLLSDSVRRGTPWFVAAPSPSARCIITVSSQRPNLKPTFGWVPIIWNPHLVWTPIEPALAESPITAIICR